MLLQPRYVSLLPTTREQSDHAKTTGKEREYSGERRNRRVAI
jgi:hypothetical protein